MRKIVAGLLAVMSLLVALPGAVLAGRGAGATETGIARPAPAGHGDGWMF